MAENYKFPEGNNFWTRASKIGRDKIFSDPKAMATAFLEYCAHVDGNEWGDEEKPIVVGQELKSVTVKHKLPYLWSGFAVFCNAHTNFFSNFRNDKSRCTPEFLEVISNIENVMRSQKFSGAAAGFFNANIISRDLGLADKIQSTGVVYQTPITKEEAKAINDALEEEF